MREIILTCPENLVDACCWPLSVHDPLEAETEVKRAVN